MKKYKIFCERLPFSDTYEWNGESFVQNSDVLFTEIELAEGELAAAWQHILNNWKYPEEVSVYPVEVGKEE